MCFLEMIWTSVPQPVDWDPNGLPKPHLEKWVAMGANQVPGRGWNWWSISKLQLFIYALGPAVQKWLKTTDLDNGLMWSLAQTFSTAIKTMLSVTAPFLNAELPQDRSSCFRKVRVITELVMQQKEMGSPRLCHGIIV